MPRANWHLEHVPVDLSDPFAAPSSQLQSAPVPIDLTDPIVLRSKLTALMMIEGKLEDRGITCPIKSRPDSCCAACPLRGTDRAERIRRLCNVGVEQERTLMSMLADDA